MNRFLLLTLVLVPSRAFSTQQIGAIPPYVEITEKQGGLAKGGTWHSNLIKGKVTSLFYVDPDERDLNAHLGEALKEKRYPLDKYQSMAIINMAATWLPNVILENLLKAKQKIYPATIFVKDKAGILVNMWSLADNSSDILIFDKTGRVLFSKDGKLSDQEVKNVLSLIDQHL